MAEANKSPKGFMCYPCRMCKNNKDYSNRKTLHDHICRWGFMDNYILWIKHRERGVVMEDGEEDDDDNNIPADWVEGGAFADFEMGEAEEDFAKDEPADELSQVLLYAKKDSENTKETKKFEKMLDDHKKLGSTLELMHWKAANGVTDKGFGELLRVVKNMFLEGTTLATYEAKKIICPLGLDVQKIHACPNNCILYHSQEYEKLDACPIYKALQYKIMRDDPGDVDG